MLAIITVVYQNYTVLSDFLASLKEQSDQNFHLILIDLSDTKKNVDLTGIRSTVIAEKNKGYSFGVNVGLKVAMTRGFTKFCIINNDVFFKKDFVRHALSSLSSHPGSIIGGKIYYAKGFEYHKGRYKKEDLGKVLWYAGGRIDWEHALTPHIGVDEIDKGQYDKERKIDFVNGACMLFDKEVLTKTGFWNEKYFLYFEDADFSVRAMRAGVDLWYVPQIILWHKNAQTTGGPGSKLHLKYQKINRLRFGLKYAPFKTKIHLLKNFAFGQ